MKISNTGAVIFDMDGVIFDTERLYLDSCVEVGKRYGMEGLEELCHSCIGLNEESTRKLTLEKYGEDFPVDKFRDEIGVIFRKHFGDGKNIIKPGVREILGSLKDAGCKVALASSTKTDAVKIELGNAELLYFFDEVIGGDIPKRGKPEPDIFLLAAERLGAVPADCYVIEDSFNGIRAAYAAGMHAIMVPDILSPDEEIRGKAEVVLDSLFDAKNYLGL